MLTVAVAPKQSDQDFMDTWNAWGPAMLARWERETWDPAHPERAAFYLVSFAWQTGDAEQGLPLPEIFPVPVPGPGPVAILSPDGQGEDVHGFVGGVRRPHRRVRPPSLDPDLAQELTQQTRRRRDWMTHHGNLHAHILVGNVPYDELARSAGSWPYRPGQNLKEITNRRGGVWAAIHYTVVQTKNKRYHSRDLQSYCDHLYGPPLESPNLQGLLDWTEAAIQDYKHARQREGALKASGNMTPDERTARARHAARCRHAKRRAAP